MGSGKLLESAPSLREYQKNISSSVLEHGSTLVVLPTGLGKTLIAFAVLAKKINSGPVLFLAPTKPLAAQHEKSARALLDLDENEIALVTGGTPAAKRKGLYPGEGKPVRLVFSTPQTVKNDIEAGRAEWNYSLVVFDEVHRAVGKYAYTFLAQEAIKRKTLVLGLTASPGGEKGKITEMLGMLGIAHVEIRAHEDADVAPYVQPLRIETIEVELTPEMERGKEALRAIIAERMATLRKMGFPLRMASKKGLVELRARILASHSPLRFSAVSHHATLFSLVHALELLETQGLFTLLNFVEKVKARTPTKAQQRLLSDERFSGAIEMLRGGAEHPKVQKLVDLLKQAGKEMPSHKAIVFCQYRDSAKFLASELIKAGMKASAFMGKKEGVTAISQKETLEKFRGGEFDVLVATSIGEEGLDIPSVDSVVFYEPVPSEIRAIQRRGRAGRAKVGRVVVLLARGTQDQAFFFASKKREEKMKKTLRKMTEGGKPKKPKKEGQMKMSDYF